MLMSTAGIFRCRTAGGNPLRLSPVWPWTSRRNRGTLAGKN